MIKKQFMVDDQPLVVAYSAYTPILYGILFPGCDYFADIGNSLEGKDTIPIYYRFAYTGAHLAADGDIKEFKEWLNDFNLLSFVNVLSDVWEFMNSNNKTSSKSKKK